MTARTLVPGSLPASTAAPSRGLLVRAEGAFRGGMAGEARRSARKERVIEILTARGG